MINYTLLCVFSQTNTYQGILITDGIQSYAVFTYNCELLNPRSIAGIGYYFSNTQFEEHPLSNTNHSSTIACVNSPSSPWNSVVFSKLYVYTCMHPHIYVQTDFVFKLLLTITGYGNTLYIGIAMVFVFPTHIGRFTFFFQFQVN